MSIAELVLRIGCALVGWLMVYAHGLLLAVVPAADCTPALGRTTLGFAGLGVLGALLLPAGLPWRESLRWGALLALPLWGLGAHVALSVLEPTTGSGATLCAALAGEASSGAAPWERLWAPAQLVAIGCGGVQSLRLWRRPVRDSVRE